MNGVKLGIVVVVALVVGALGGGVLARQQLTSQLTQLVQERDKAQQDAKKEAAARRDAEQQVADAKAALDARNAEFERVRADHEALAEEQAAAPEPVLATPAAEEPTPPPPAANVPPPPGRFADGRPVGPGDPNDPQFAPGERMNFSQRMRERMEGFIDNEATKSTDPAVQQRLATLREQSDYMLDVMQRMRDTMDEKERASLQEEFQQVRSTVSGLVQEQQDHILRQVAVQNGITDPQKQQTFMNSIRETQASPFFNSQMMSFGGMRRGGGPGGR